MILQPAQALKVIKTTIQQKRWQLIPRAKNNTTITELGLNEDAVKSIIMDLIASDYVSGPGDDRDKSGTGFMWIFGSDIYGCECYIKHKIFKIGEIDYAKCISFHRADSQIKYR